VGEFLYVSQTLIPSGGGYLCPSRLLPPTTGCRVVWRQASAIAASTRGLLDLKQSDSPLVGVPNNCDFQRSSIHGESFASKNPSKAHSSTWAGTVLNRPSAHEMIGPMQEFQTQVALPERWDDNGT